MQPIIENSIKKVYGGPVKAVIFDWGGTLVDPFVISPTISFVNAFKMYGFNISAKEARKPMGIRKDLHIKSILDDYQVRARWIREMGKEPTEHDIHQIYDNFEKIQLKILPSYANLVPGATETIQLLKDKYNIKIGTTTGFDKKMVDIILDKNKGFNPDSNVAGDDLLENLGCRPQPFMLWKNLFHMGIFPIQSVVKVDDTVSGIEEGLNAGCWTVGVSDWGNYMNINSMSEYEKMSYYQLEEKRKIAKRKLLNSGAHYIIDSVVNLPKVIDDIHEKLESEVPP